MLSYRSSFGIYTLRHPSRPHHSQLCQFVPCPCLLGQLLVVCLSLQLKFALYVCTLWFERGDVSMHCITQNVALVLVHYVPMQCVVDCTGHSAFHMYYVRIPLEHK